MTREWLETIRALAHKSTLGELLMIAPPGSAETDNMRRRLDLLADFAQHVVEVADDDCMRSDTSCRKCEGKMLHGVALENTTTGSPDFIGGDVVTMSASGLAQMVDCLKCEWCGHSVSCPATIHGSHSEPPTQDRRTGPRDRRLAGHGLLWLGFEVERSSAPGRRSTDRYFRQEPQPPADRCT